MPNYAVDYSYTDYNVINLEAEDMKDAEVQALQLIKAEYPELENVEIEGVLEV